MAAPDDQTAGLSGDEKIVAEARERLKRGLEWEDLARRNCHDDRIFANADARNHNQWPDTIYQGRTDDDDRPCLTINKVRTHNRICINEAMQNKASVKIRPTAGRASYEGAQAYQTLIRRIEYISKADVAYRNAITHQVEGGCGYVSIDTDYVSDKTFDQDIFIRPVRDPMCVILDCDAKMPTGIDANWGFEFEDVLRADFDRQYPKLKGMVGSSTLGIDDTWLNDKYIRRAMYYRRNGEDDTLVTFVEPETGKRVTTRKSEYDKVLIEPIIAQIQSGELDGNLREIENQKVEWFLIAGDKVIDRGEWAGKYVPILRLVGEEIVIDGKLDRKGLTRYLIDQQRMLNYNASASVEFGALQSKTPYVGPARAFEGQEQWKDANKKNYAFLQYNDIDDTATGEFQKVERPERQPPPQSAPVYSEGALNAEKWMMMASGQYQEKQGASSETVSGKAINARERQGDTATYHFVEHQGDLLRDVGVQLLDLIPKIYDTERMLHVFGDDGTKSWIKIDPQSEEAAQELKQETEEAAILTFNPKVGEYDCAADVGPNYATQRQEAWNAMSMILAQNAELASYTADILFANGDWPGAEELRERVKKQIKATKPYLFDEGANPSMVQLQEQLQAMQKLNAELMQKYSEMQLRLKGKDEKRDIEAYRAETVRVKDLANSIPDLGSREDLISLIRETIAGMKGHDITDEINAQQVP